MRIYITFTPFVLLYYTKGLSRSALCFLFVAPSSKVSGSPLPILALPPFRTSFTYRTFICFMMWYLFIFICSSIFLPVDAGYSDGDKRFTHRGIDHPFPWSNVPGQHMDGRHAICVTGKTSQKENSGKDTIEIKSPWEFNTTQLLPYYIGIATLRLRAGIETYLKLKDKILSSFNFLYVIWHHIPITHHP